MVRRTVVGWMGLALCGSVWGNGLLPGPSMQRALDEGMVVPRWLVALLGMAVSAALVAGGLAAARRQGRDGRGDR